MTENFKGEHVLLARIFHKFRRRLIDLAEPCIVRFARKGFHKADLGC